MLAIKMSAGVTVGVNIRNPLCTDEKVCKQGIHPGFDIQGRYHQKSKTEVQVAPQKALTFSKTVLN